MLSKFTVLVVDDEPDKRQLLKVALEMAGYTVHTANDGAEGLAAVESQPFDLIVTDVMMPNLDGYEMVKRIRANPQTRFIPVIIQTAAKGAAQDARRGSQVGALGYITDPTDLDLLLARARTLLDFKNYLDSCEEAAFTDHLTGLANRRRFERQLERAVARPRRLRPPLRPAAPAGGGGDRPAPMPRRHWPPAAGSGGSWSARWRARAASAARSACSCST